MLEADAKDNSSRLSPRTKFGPRGQLVLEAITGAGIYSL